jgi:hypothetical protein
LLVKSLAVVEKAAHCLASRLMSNSTTLIPNKHVPVHEARIIVVVRNTELNDNGMEDLHIYKVPVPVLIVLRLVAGN